MSQSQDLLFGPFRLDAENGRLWRGTVVVELPPKAFDLLHYLARHPDRLLSKDALLDAVWPRRVVSESVLKGCVNALRKALADDSKAPGYIETVPKRGYRFIAEVKPFCAAAVPALADCRNAADARGWVGRKAPLARLEAHWQRALRGERQFVLVSGEAGIGKTTLADMFLRGVATGAEVLSARCVEHYGVGEAFMPLLEALEQRCREDRGWLERLRRQAPTWLMQMPSVLEPEALARLKQEVLGANESRMLREAAEFLEGQGGATPLILVVEDLHWSDRATLALMGLLARRSAPARLLVLGTYRPLDGILAGHPIRALRQDLLMRGLCAELALDWLSEEETGEYLRSRYPGGQADAGLLAYVYQRTEGHPLFMVQLVEHLLGLGLLRRGDAGWLFAPPGRGPGSDIPDTVGQMIELHIERFDAQGQGWLELASGLGAAWPAALLARVAGRDVGEIESWCQGLARRGDMLALRGTVEWPDGTVTGQFAFRHALYAEIAYSRLAPGQRVGLHGRAGACLEAAYGARARAIAAELAMHFEKARNPPQAVKYLRLAAENALGRYANREALDYLERAWTAAEPLPAAERDAVRLELLLLRGTVQRNRDAMAEAVEDFAAARSLAVLAGQKTLEIRAMMELCKVFFWTDRPRCLDLAAEVIACSRELADDSLKAQIRGYCAGWRINLRGWDAQDARACRAGMALAGSAQNPHLLGLRFGVQASVEFFAAAYRAAAAVAADGMAAAQSLGEGLQYMICVSVRVRALLHLGEWGEARRQLRGALAMAEKNGNVFAIITFSLESAWMHELAFDYAGAQRLCEAAMAQMRGRQDSYISFFGLIRLGSAYLGLRQYPQAAECFKQIASLSQTPGFMMDWHLRLFYHQGLGDLRLAQGQLAQALEQAGRLCELAALPPDPGYLALGHRLAAEVALARGDLDAAGGRLGQAFGLLARETPLAAWQVCATAARWNRHRGDATAAESCQQQAAGLLQALAGSLDSDDPLRHSLLAHPLLSPGP